MTKPEVDEGTKGVMPMVKTYAAPAVMETVWAIGTSATAGMPLLT